MVGVKLGKTKWARTHIISRVFRTHRSTYCGRFTKESTFPLAEHRTRVCRKCTTAWQSEQKRSDPE